MIFFSLNKNRRKAKGKAKNPRRAGRRKQSGPQVHTVPGNQFYTDGERAVVKYTDQILLVQGASGGALNSLSYKLNSVFQVNSTASAGTPQGVAELSAKYKKYRVEHSRIHWRIRLMQPGGTFGSLGVLGAAATTTAMFNAVAYPLQTSASAATSITAAAVQKYAVRRYDWPRVFGVPGAATPESTVVNPAVVWKGGMSMSPAKLDGDPDPKQASYVANFGTDPVASQFWVFSFQDILADATAKGVWLAEVEVYQTVYCFDRLLIGDALESRPLAPVVMVPSCKQQEEKQEAPLPRSSDRVDAAAPPLRADEPSVPSGWVLVKRA